MWLIHRSAHGLFVWSVLVVGAVSLPQDFQKSDAWPAVDSSSVKVQLKSKHLPKGQRIYHRSAAKKARLLQSDQSYIPSGLQRNDSAPTSDEVQRTGPPPTMLLSMKQSLDSNYGIQKVVALSFLGMSQPMALLFKHSLHSMETGTLGRVVALGLAGILVLGLVFALCFTDDSVNTWNLDHPSDRSTKLDSIREVKEEEEEVVKLKQSLKERKDQKETKSVRQSNTKASLVELESTPSSGTWAITYRTAPQSTKAALELLFLCNIIPLEEFAHSYVSQEHINECVWIAGQMLLEKSLDDWVDSKSSARKTFEESVTACFSARTDVIASLFGSFDSPAPPGTSPSAGALQNSPRTSDRSHGSDRGVVDCRTPQRMSSTPQTAVPAPITPLDPIGSSPSTFNNLTEDHIASPDRHPRSVYIRSNVSTGLLSEEPLSPAFGQLVPLSASIRAHSPLISPTSDQPKLSPPAKEFQQLLSQPASRDSVVSRCREIMRDTPPQSSQSPSKGVQRMGSGGVQRMGSGQRRMGKIAESPVGSFGPESLSDAPGGLGRVGGTPAALQGESVVVATMSDSVKKLTFPSPGATSGLLHSPGTSGLRSPLPASSAADQLQEKGLRFQMAQNSFK